MEPSLPILFLISKEVAKVATTEGLALEETLATPIEITLLAVEERIMAEITTAMVEEVVKSVTITILETTFFHLQKNGKTYDVNKIILPREYDIKTENDKGDPDLLNQIVFTEEIRSYFRPAFLSNISVSSSPKKELIVLYDEMSSSSDFPSHISIGNSSDIKWIPLTPVVLDSTKFLNGL